MKTIEDGAFEGCSQLADVYYNGTQAQWNEIAVGSLNEDLLSAAIHFMGERRIEAGETVRLDESTQQKLILDGGTLILGEGVEATVEAYSGTLVLKDNAAATLTELIAARIVDESDYDEQKQEYLGGEAVVRLGEGLTLADLYAAVCPEQPGTESVVPMYDAEKDGCRLFRVGFTTRKPNYYGRTGYKLLFRPVFLNEDGYALLKAQGDDVLVCLEILYNGTQFHIEAGDSGVYCFTQEQQDEFCDGWKEKIFYVCVTNMQPGDEVQIRPYLLLTGNTVVAQNSITAVK